MRKNKIDEPTDEQLSIRTGDKVTITEDNGSITETVARSEPWQLGHGAWVVLLQGRSGGYDLTRCQKVG